MLKYVDELEKEDLKGKHVLLRLDLNAPVLDGEIIDTYRLERVIETIDFLRSQEAKIIIISHCDDKESATLIPAWNYLKGYFPMDFCKTYFTPEAIDKVLKLENKGILLFENIRINPEEEKNDRDFAKKLAGMADVFVNDAFGAMHRRHASIIGVPEFLPHYGGLLVRQEIEHLSRVFSRDDSSLHPFIFILGGIKFETKIPLIKKYLDKADHVFVAGALANDIFREKGFEVGTSAVSTGDFGIKEIVKNPKLISPIDVTVRHADGSSEFKTPDKVLPDEYIIDVGPETIAEIKKFITESKTVVWNGPLGKYKKGYKDMTENLAEIIASNTQGGAMTESIIGGGDTIAAITSLGLNHKFSFISTGGGAMLDFLVNETLVGIEALEN